MRDSRSQRLSVETYIQSLRARGWLPWSQSMRDNQAQRLSVETHADMEARL